MQLLQWSILQHHRTALPLQTETWVYGSQQGVKVNSGPRMILTRRHFNPPDLLLVFKAHWKVPDCPDSVPRWQSDEFLDQVLFLCHTQDDKTSPSCYLVIGYHPGCKHHTSHCKYPQQVLTPVWGSYHSPFHSWWRLLWKPYGQDQQWETCSSASLWFLSISLSCSLEEQTKREECVLLFASDYHGFCIELVI